jgi:hypothetical protein
MERYFEKFQTISYANTLVRNITQRTVILNSVYNNPEFYYPYDIAQGERSDMIADRYYDDQYMAWLLYLSNSVIDPYYDWYVDPSTFEAFIVKKYGSLANALNKVKYYRNNWYSDASPTISATAYNSLTSSVTKFYEPVPINGVVTNNPSEYTRRKVDWKIQTNAIAKYSVANGASFATDEIVDVKFDVSTSGAGQVTFANTTTVFLQHLTGTTTSGTITGSSYLYGRESNTNTVFSTASLVANNIPAAESPYWSPVTYFEYETEINEQNKSILVLKKEYSSKAAKQLKDLLR